MKAPWDGARCKLLPPSRTCCCPLCVAHELGLPAHRTCAMVAGLALGEQGPAFRALLGAILLHPVPSPLTCPELHSSTLHLTRSKPSLPFPGAARTGPEPEGNNITGRE